VLGLKAVDCASGDMLAEEQTTASGKETVLNALGQEAARLREGLGESLASVQKFDTPLEQATTSSLEALKACTLAITNLRKQGSAAALPYFERAVELDPSFARAYVGVGVTSGNIGQTVRAREYLAKAFALREHTSEREKLDITALYYDSVTGELAKADRTWQEYMQEYPKDALPYGNLSSNRGIEGNYAAAVELVRQALRLDPDAVISYANLGAFLAAQGRLDEARKTYEEALSHKLDDDNLHLGLYSLAFLARDSQAMASQAAWFEGKPEVRHEILSVEADTEAYNGRLARARELTRQAEESAVRAAKPEAAAECALDAALREAAFGNGAEARRETETALRLAPDSRDVQVQAALAYAWSSNVDGARKLETDLKKRFPLDSLVNDYWLPTIDARTELAKNNPPEALDRLHVLSPPMELGSVHNLGIGTFPYSVYTRGEAYLASGQGGAAISEFQKILDHGQIVSNCPAGPLSYLGLARAYALTGDRVKARTKYGDFLALWKDADPDIPILKQAKAEYAKLQ
jgi:tetratricopeptide (TPR) repeat protein